VAWVTDIKIYEEPRGIAQILAGNNLTGDGAKSDVRYHPKFNTKVNKQNAHSNFSIVVS
jgi:hypothetical protein